MKLEQLHVLHLSKRTGTTAGEHPTHPGLFVFDSCQRKLWVGMGEHFSQWRPAAGLKMLTGEAAYLFLLRVATGLESAIPGETDVFGQFKQAWKDYEESRNLDLLSLKRKLAPWIQKLFADTKEIRTSHLENLGGASYGALVRRALNSGSHDRILIVGTGKIAQSVVPYLLQSELLITNRRPEMAHALAEELKSKGATKVRVLVTEEEVSTGWREADHAVICIPVDAATDSERIRLWQMGQMGQTAGAASGRSKQVVHLGCLRGQVKDSWERVTGFHSLDSLFEMRSMQVQALDAKLHEARQACRERVKLRALGNSITIPHGWEDLACFA